MIIITVDPGLWSGMAFWDTKLMEKPSAIEVPYPETGARLDKWLYSSNARLDRSVACERYVMTPGVKSAQPEALMGMGAVEHVCNEHRIPVIWQMPRDAKKRCPDSLLRKLGWYVKTKDGHANDAQRHIVEFLANHYTGEYAHLVGI